MHTPPQQSELLEQGAGSPRQHEPLTQLLCAPGQSICVVHDFEHTPLMHEPTKHDDELGPHGCPVVRALWQIPAAQTLRAPPLLLQQSAVVEQTELMPKQHCPATQLPDGQSLLTEQAIEH